jgi:hypothetical protein
MSKNFMVWVLPLKEDCDILVESKGGKVFQKVLNGNVVYRPPQYSTEKRKGVTMNRISERTNIAACLGLVLLILLPIGRAKGASDNASKLLDLARKKFGALTETEKILFQAVVNGELADFSDSLDKNNDPNGAEKWGDERVLKADRIAWLCTDPEASDMVTHKGIRVKGARIDGELDLEYARISFPLYFEKSAFPGGTNLRYAEIRELFLIGTHTGPINADGVKIEGHIFLRDGFKAEGPVNLRRATIGRDLSCIGAQFINEGAKTLNADGAKIEGYVFLCDDFKAEGEVNLLGATIGRNLECDGSQFINKGAKALNADGAKIEGSVFLLDDFKAEGEVNLLRATIGGGLDCEKGEFINEGAKAINADGVNIEGYVFLRKGFKAEGKVSLVDATIDSYFVWTDVNSPEKATLDLRSATVGILYDDVKSWPDEGRLFLHGLVYSQIHDDAPRGAKSRIDWLQRQPGFWPQPYEQLAEVLRKSGRDDDAKKILIAKNEDKARLTKLTWGEWLWYRIFGRIVGYGYRPWLAAWIGLVIVLLGWILFCIGYHSKPKIMTPTKRWAYISEKDREEHKISKDYPKFNSLVYSLDVFVPLVDLHQASYWLPNANIKRESISEIFKLPISGRVLRCYFWVHITMGWAITMLLVAGLTGLIRT